jgi:hypothetical protein
MHAVCCLVRAPHMFLDRIYSAPRISASKLRPQTRVRLVSENSAPSSCDPAHARRLGRRIPVCLGRASPLRSVRFGKRRYLAGFHPHVL